jgi:hypothetical protein
MDLNELRSQIRGDVVAISDPEYEEVSPQPGLQ